jgi:hypothetical protein
MKGKLVRNSVPLIADVSDVAEVRVRSATDSAYFLLAIILSRTCGWGGVALLLKREFRIVRWTYSLRLQATTNHNHLKQFLQQHRQFTWDQRLHQTLLSTSSSHQFLCDQLDRLFLLVQPNC